MMIKQNRLLPVLLWCLAFAFCGNKGALVLEPETLPPKIQNLAIRQKGNTIRLEWSFPQQLNESHVPLDLEKIGRVFILFTDVPLPAEKFAKKADLFSKIYLRDMERLEGRSFSASLPFKTKDLKGKKYFFALRYEYAKKNSELSQEVSIDTAVPPMSIQNLSLSQEKKTLILRWTGPTLDIGQKPLPKILGFYVYRAVQNEGKSPPSFRCITPSPLPSEYYEDPDLNLEGEYVYAVTTVLSPQVESEYSNHAKIKIRDTFPPDTPQQLVAFTGPDHVLLTWEPVLDTDLSYYRIYRKVKEDGQFQLLADAIKENQYKDFQVKKDQSYFYTVSAVDRRGNESEMSSLVRHQF